MTKYKTRLVTGKQCINCGKVIFAEWGEKKLLDHDLTHTTGWMELQRKRRVR